MQCVDDHQLAKLEEIRNTPRLLQRLIELGIAAWNVDIPPELLSQLSYFAQRRLQACFIPRHAAIIPHDLSELAMERHHGASPIDRQQLSRALGDLRFYCFEFRM